MAHGANASQATSTMTEKVKETPESEQNAAPPDGGLVAWLVVLSCFFYNFNLLGITYSYGNFT